MSYDSSWAPYVSTAERRRKAEREVARLRKKGVPVAPVVISGRAITSTFWGKAWCDNLESYQEFSNRLDRGRSYVRNGSVLDLQIAAREATALVSGSAVYRVSIRIEPVPKAQWTSIRKDCSGGINSLVELLQGRLSQGVMERICRQGGGLFPEPRQIRFACSCPDFAPMCKHVAAVLYGIGARLDHQPELLFRLRAVEAKDLLVQIDQALPLVKTRAAGGRVLETSDLSSMFGLDLAADEAPLSQPARAKRLPMGKRAPAKTVKPATAVKTKAKTLPRRSVSAG